MENGALRDTREKNPEIGSKNATVTLHYSSESNYKIKFVWSKELGSKLGMLVWEGDQKHLPPFIIQTREERGVRCNRPAGLECCRRSEAHGRRPGMLSTIE